MSGRAVQDKVTIKLYLHLKSTRYHDEACSTVGFVTLTLFELTSLDVCVKCACLWGCTEDHFGKFGSLVCDSYSVRAPVHSGGAFHVSPPLSVFKHPFPRLAWCSSRPPPLKGESPLSGWSSFLSKKKKQTSQDTNQS